MQKLTENIRPPEAAPRRWLSRLVGLFLQSGAIVLTLFVMAGAENTKWGFFLRGVAMGGGFMLWKEAEKVGRPKSYTINAADIENDEQVAAAVSALNAYIARREANTKGSRAEERE